VYTQIFPARIQVNHQPPSLSLIKDEKPSTPIQNYAGAICLFHPRSFRSSLSRNSFVSAIVIRPVISAASSSRALFPLFIISHHRRRSLYFYLSAVIWKTQLRSKQFVASHTALNKSLIVCSFSLLLSDSPPLIRFSGWGIGYFFFPLPACADQMQERLVSLLDCISLYTQLLSFSHPLDSTQKKMLTQTRPLKSQ